MEYWIEWEELVCFAGITSNKAFADWTELFHDSVVVTAILDRLLHDAVVINIRGNSFRLRNKIHLDPVSNHDSEVKSGTVCKTENGTVCKTENGTVLQDH